MKVFSCEKYRAWCREHGQEFYDWAIECDKKPVEAKKNCGCIHSIVDTGLYSSTDWETNMCPKCGRLFDEVPAISRRDGKTEICPECGMAEALEDAGCYLS